MTKRKIWAILGEFSTYSEKNIGMLLDNLAQRIFLPELDFETIQNYYVTRKKILNEKYPSKMGSFEKLLWDKLVHPPRNVLLLIGGAGCGKTTSTKFIVWVMKDEMGDCGELNVCRNRSSLCKGRRLHVVMDFNEVNYMHEEDHLIAHKEFVRDLANRMSATLYGTLEPTETTEFIDFWNHEIKRQEKEMGLQFAFAEIENEMYHRVGPGWEKETDQLHWRKEALKEIQKKGDLFLDYQCRFWRYVLEKVFGGKRQCIFAIVDNIDCANPVVQGIVRDVIVSHQGRFGNTFMVALRPETIMVRPRGVSANLTDTISHSGPEPFDVIVDRLKRFVDDPTPFFRPGELDKHVERHVYKFAKELYKHLTDKKNGKIIREFVESLAGTNIRNALLMATNLLKLDIHDLTPRELNRACVSSPYEPHRKLLHSAVENIFHVKGSPEKRFLVKGRMLQLLRSDEQNRKNISELLTILTNFGYDLELICKACNEMMEPAHQLIISNGKSLYSISKLKQYENDTIMLTPAGIGYADKLIHDLDYIEMAMLDCVVENSDFPTVVSHPLLRRLRAVVVFLNMLNKVDRMEMSELKIKSGRDSFVSTFGEETLTWGITRDVCMSIWRILLLLEREKPEYLEDIEFCEQMIKVYKDIDDVMNISAMVNEEALGKKVQHVVPRPSSQKLLAIFQS